MNKFDLIREKREEFKKILIASREEEFVPGNGVFLGRTLGFNKQKLESIKKEVAEALMQLGVDEKRLVSLGEMTGFEKLHNYDDVRSLDLLVAASDACGFIDNSDRIQVLNYTALLSVSKHSQYNIDPVRCFGPLARSYLSDEEIAAAITDVGYKNMLFYVNGDKIEKAALGIDVDKSANYSGVQKVLNKEYIP